MCTRLFSEPLLRPSKERIHLCWRWRRSSGWRDESAGGRSIQVRQGNASENVSHSLLFCCWTIAAHVLLDGLLVPDLEQHLFLCHFPAIHRSIQEESFYPGISCVFYKSPRACHYIINYRAMLSDNQLSDGQVKYAIQSVVLFLVTNSSSSGFL